PHFENSGPIGGYLLVFPRTSVSITHVGREPVITSPNVVMFYNLGQEYRRGKVSERGDVCEWFAFHPDVIVDALKPYDVTVQDRADQPFRFTHGPSETATFLQQRMVVEHLLQGESPDALWVEETMLALLDRCLAIRYGHKPRKENGQINPEHKELVQAMQCLLTTHFHEPITLEYLARALHYSQYQLARIFRQQTGQTIHQYLDQLRVRTALEELTSGEKDLSALAYALGYSSHSHFTAAFKRSFGNPPSYVRETTQWINSVLPASQHPFTKRAKI
ncbi:MAG TPA: AraC family transcriptional regulator, partial [Anaerolineales bacterium]|nr:AraC family transcriptional regulator [Anaerolineales bacterium]